jgi:hypothetical protein
MEEMQMQPERWTPKPLPPAPITRYRGSYGPASLEMRDEDLGRAAHRIFSQHRRAELEQILTFCDTEIRTRLEHLIATRGAKL